MWKEYVGNLQRNSVFKYIDAVIDTRILLCFQPTNENRQVLTCQKVIKNHAKWNQERENAYQISDIGKTSEIGSSWYKKYKTLFLTSMSLVIFCLLFSLVDYVPVKGEIIWYLSLTTWLISLSIMLSSSIHAVTKGISSFFLSAV